MINAAAKVSRLKASVRVVYSSRSEKHLELIVFDVFSVAHYHLPQEVDRLVVETNQQRWRDQRCASLLSRSTITTCLCYRQRLIKMRYFISADRRRRHDKSATRLASYRQSDGI